MQEKVIKGRPINYFKKSEKEILCYNLLDELNIEYYTLDHKFSAETMEICEMIDKELGAKICKNLFLCNRQKTNFYLLIMPGDKVFKTKELSSQLNVSRLSFAESDAMRKYLNVSPGSVSILGLMFDLEMQVNLLIDQDILNQEYIGCHPLVNTSSLKIKLDDILGKFLKHTKHTYKVVNLVGE